MKSRKLQPLPDAVRSPPIKTCIACKAFRAECEVPYDNGTWPMCWLCAHQVVDHGTMLFEAVTAECECLPEAIYPASVIALRRERRVADAESS